jgi:hypothetical protein
MPSMSRPFMFSACRYAPVLAEPVRLVTGDDYAPYRQGTARWRHVTEWRRRCSNAVTTA